MTIKPTPMPFAGGQLDYAEDRRTIGDIRKFLDNKKSRAVLFQNGKPAMDENGALHMVHPSDLKGTNVAQPAPVLLGIRGDQPVFAFALHESQKIVPAEAFQEMRFIAGRMKPDELAIAGRARSLFEWHHQHQFCSSCGAKSTAASAGMYSHCNSCQTDHFPRVNPVVIMLILREDECLLGRSPGWPEGAYSALAGFVSPGESMEEACVRETKEEVGIDVTNVNYVFSQPWPFPSQLMMGLICHTDQDKITLNQDELEAAKWFSKETVQAVFNKQSEAFLRPPRFTIAHHLLRYWLSQ
ncbi:MAG: NAD(+) diphosphatase [Hellea sp.]|nr:NAD(+) diphosphatase [Hellea sp.]